MSSAIRRKGAITGALRAVPHRCASKLPTLASETPTKDKKSKQIHDQKLGNRVNCRKARLVKVRWWVGDLSFAFVFKSYSSVLKKLFEGKSKTNFAKRKLRLAQPRRGAQIEE